MTYMLLLNCALKLVEEIILYYDARSKKHQIVNYSLIFLYTTVINILTNNFSKEQCTLPEDDLRIETCRSILSVLV